MTNTEREIKLFGMTISDIEDSLKDNVFYQINPESGIKQIAMSYISDAQECMNRGIFKTSNEYMNIAKYLLSKI